MPRRNTAKRRHNLTPRQRAEKAAARAADRDIVIAMTAEEVTEAEQRLIRKLDRLAASLQTRQDETGAPPPMA